MFLSFDKFLIYAYQANKAALKAIIVNRVADVFFIIGIIMLLVLFKTTDYIIIFQLVSHMDFLNFSLLIFGFKFGRLAM